MSGGLLADLRARAERTRRFFSHDIWEARLDELPARKAFAYRSARIFHCTFRGFFLEETLHIRAAALTYFSVLSIVPLLAFAFALLKGFGAYEALIDGTIRPYVLNLLAGNEPLRQAFEKTLGFVEQTGVASLGFLGLIFLLYAATRLLRNIEGALNEIWGAKSARDLLEQLRDYVSIIVVTPLSLMAAVALTTMGQMPALVRAAGETLGVSGLMDRAVALLTPLAVLFMGLSFLYIVLPHATVRVRSAMVGAAIGSVVWYAVLIIHVRFQVGVARFNALYSSFAAFPIFLAWQQVSWVVVLLGAKIASIHQHHRSLAQRARLANADQAFREVVCLSALLEVVRAFVNGAAHPTPQHLSTQLDAPEQLIMDGLSPLVAAGLLVETSAPRSHAYALAKSPEAIHVKDALDALRRSPEFRFETKHAAGLDPAAIRVWLELDGVLERSSVNCTLLELVRDVARAQSPSVRDLHVPAEMTTLKTVAPADPSAPREEQP